VPYGLKNALVVYRPVTAPPKPLMDMPLVVVRSTLP